MLPQPAPRRAAGTRASWLVTRPRALSVIVFPTHTTQGCRHLSLSPEMSDGTASAARLLGCAPTGCDLQRSRDRPAGTALPSFCPAFSAPPPYPASLPPPLPCTASLMHCLPALFSAPLRPAPLPPHLTDPSPLPAPAHRTSLLFRASCSCSLPLSPVPPPFLAAPPFFWGMLSATSGSLDGAGSKGRAVAWSALTPRP